MEIYQMLVLVTAGIIIHFSYSSINGSGFAVEHITAIITFLALGGIWVAYQSYCKQKEKENLDRIFSIIRTFRIEVLQEAEKAANIIIQRDLSAIILTGFDPTTLRQESKKTKEAFLAYCNQVITSSKEKTNNPKKDQELIDAVNKSLNVLEEFSMQVLLSGMEDNEVFDVVKQSFVQIVIQASPLLYLNKNTLGYPHTNTIKLYQKWLPHYKDTGKEDEIIRPFSEIREALMHDSENNNDLK